MNVKKVLNHSSQYTFVDNMKLIKQSFLVSVLYWSKGKLQQALLECVTIHPCTYPVGLKYIRGGMYPSVELNDLDNKYWLTSFWKNLKQIFMWFSYLTLIGLLQLTIFDQT